ncbi:hypothetical protein [Anaerobaca lacustris]|uniref:Uncharacterized protein n=1 Tax=Anaerobaca lacustris TaxID=3044600 RepID=A0AAW6U895_9BACT|nr:hypothetical protein [Sedimentisphaerales bacterium M17dextr]
MKRTLICLLLVVPAVLLGIGAVLALPVGLLALAFRVDSTPDRAMLALPDGVHAIEHSRVRLPAICAEYSREVTYVTNGVRGKTTPLQVDGCGGYPINCYLIETPRGPLLRLDDAVSQHLLDVTTQTTYAVWRVYGDTYIGELRDERASFNASMANDDPSTRSVTIGGRQAKPLTDLTQDAPEVYVGRFGAGPGGFRFTPASESPEVAIRHHFDR